ncbi:hypothetical protein TNCV_1570901 [Trichonephila clavipes]|uniref:Uncharacterized protein n=1 Tax=Trichonephila clavipes TaxID=2585209 RepID=A0A8X6VP64_TRICX|nr:hypothetical protein TNCV_1570901 [Trichonephila clavipes]
MPFEQRGMSPRKGSPKTFRTPENVERVRVSIQTAKWGHSPRRAPWFPWSLKSSLPRMTDLPARGRKLASINSHNLSPSGYFMWVISSLWLIKIAPKPRKTYGTTSEPKLTISRLICLKR